MARSKNSNINTPEAQEQQKPVVKKPKQEYAGRGVDTKKKFVPTKSVSSYDGLAEAMANSGFYTVSAEIPVGTMANGDNNGITEHNVYRNYADDAQVNTGITALNAAQRAASAVVYDLVPLWGGNNNEIDSPINRACYNIYQYVCTALGNMPDFKANDIAPYIIAFCSAYQLLTQLIRDIRLVRMQVRLPDFLPQGVWASLGYTGYTSNYQALWDIGKNTNLYIDQLNLAVQRLNVVPIPNNIPLIDFNTDLLSTVYKDSESEDTSQYMFFALDGVYRYNEVKWGDTSGKFPFGPCVTYTKLKGSTTYDTFTKRIGLLNEMINELSIMSDSSMIPNKIYNAYGTADLYSIDYANRDMEVPVAFSKDLNIAVRNAILCDDIVIENIIADAATNRIVGRPKLPFNMKGVRSMVNIPLQFKDDDEITRRTLTHALRFRPFWRNTDKDQLLTAPAENIQPNVNAGWDYGFAVIARFTIWTYTGKGDWESYKVTERNDFSINLLGHYLDFEALPIPVLIDVTGTGTASAPFALTVRGYLAPRGHEVQISSSAITKYFESFAIHAWSANVLPQAPSQRTKA